MCGKKIKRVIFCPANEYVLQAVGYHVKYKPPVFTYGVGPTN